MNSISKIIFIIVLALFLFKNGKAQNTRRTDSTVINKVDSLALLARSIWYNDTDSAKKIAKLALEIAENGEYKEGVAKSYNIFGVIYDIYGDYDKSFSFYKKAHEIFFELGDEWGMANCSYNMGLVLQNDKMYEDALIYVENAHQYFKEENMLSEIAMSTMTLGNLYFNNGRDLDQVLEKMEEAELLSREINDTLYICSSLNLQGNVYVSKNLFIDKAIVCFNEAIHLMNDIQNSWNLGYSFLGLSKAYLQKGEFDKAQINNQYAFEHYNKINQKKGIQNVYENRAKIYEALGDYSSATKSYKILNLYADSIYNYQRSKQVTFLKAEYETEKINQEKVLAENRAELAESESQKNQLLFIGSSSIAFLIILAALFYYAKLKQTKKAEIIKLELISSQKQLALEKQYRDSELKALKAQMNPHFIFNVLNSIQEFIVLNQKELASEYLAMFAELIRSYLHFSNTGVITLKEETDTLTKYLELETLRFEDSFTYDLSIDELVHPEELNIPTMMIQPYVENAIKHGLFHKQNRRKLTVGFSILSNTILQCVITDNGIGREESKRINAAKKSPGHKSFAMEATANRLELYNQKTSNKIGVETIDLFTDNKEPKGTKVILSIPLL